MPDRDAAAWLWLRERLAALRPAARPGVPTDASAVVVRTAVVTDSASALPADWVRACASDGLLTVIPMPVMVGEEIYGEGEDDITETIALALAGGKSVKTSRPSPGQFEQAFHAAERGGYEAVVSIHISGGLSGTADAARLAAGRVNIPVEVVDSGTVGMALGMGVQSAVAAAAAGLEAAAVSDRRDGPAGTDQGLLLRSQPGAAAPGRTDRRRRLAAGDDVRHQTHPGGRRREDRSAGKGQVSSQSHSPARGDCRRGRRVPSGRAWPGWRSTTLGIRRRPRGWRPGWPRHCPGCPPAQISSLPAVLAAHAGLGVLAVIVGESAPPPVEPELLST